jgi:hypothetical protein
MWGLFVGLGIGVLQVLALRALVRMIMGTQKALGALLLLLKIGAVVAILWLVSTVSLTHLIWAAGGMFAGLILGFVIVQLLQKRAGNDGKDLHHD